MPPNDPTGIRFGEAVAAYERGRPEYPESAVDWLLGDRPQRVVDLGAGTGKLTRAIAARAPSLVAVEPDPVMRRALASVLPQVPVLDGLGEALPLPDDDADLIVAGQSWHWMDPVRAVPEVARVLRPGGYLGLVWNDRDEDDPWVAALSSLLAEFGTSPDAGYEPSIGLPFGPVATFEHSWMQETTVEGVVDMIVSRSYVIALPEGRRHELIGRLRALAGQAADQAGVVPVPYVTRAYRARLG